MVLASSLGCSDDEPLQPAASSATASSSSNGGGGAGGAGGQGGSAGAGGSCTPSLAVNTEPPETLSATGLYADIATKELAAYAQPFAPQFLLWSDGADKQRWVYLPECEGTIDTTDMN